MAAGLKAEMLIPFVKAICVDIRPAEADSKWICPRVSKTWHEVPSADHLSRFLRRAFQIGRGGARGGIRRARIHMHDLRNWTHDLHRTVDDRPFGGGEGMLLKPEPIFDAVESIWPERTPKQKVILLSAQGRSSRSRLRGNLRSTKNCC
jgi:hypothetical protein